MKKTLATAAVLGLLCTPQAFAQEDEKSAPEVSPVEIYTCNYNEGKGPADLKAAADAWNAWADEREMDSYFAAVLTPWYSAELGWDVAWLGAWKNGTAMGAGTDQWLTEGGEEGAGFAAAVTCATHVGFASVMNKAPAGEGAPDDLVLTFADCSIMDGVTGEDLWPAMEEWTTFSKERGYRNGQWIMWPTYGMGKIEYDFKMVNAYENHAELGKDWDLYAEGDYDKHGELLGDKLDCDVPRMYNAKVIRRAAGEE